MERRIEKIVEILNRKYKIISWKEEPFRALITTVLSQRTKDQVTEKTSDQLFKVANTPKKILKLTKKRIEKLIYPTGFYRQKARRIRQICGILLEKHGGKVPGTREELMQLPGVGAKTASIVLAYSFGVPTIAVDTHVNRISQRLGFVPRGYKPEKTQEVLERLIPKRLHILVNHLFVTFGQDTCVPIRPKCHICPVVKLCPYENKNLIG